MPNLQAPSFLLSLQHGDLVVSTVGSECPPHGCVGFPSVCRLSPRSKNKYQLNQCVCGLFVCDPMREAEETLADSCESK